MRQQQLLEDLAEQEYGDDCYDTDDEDITEGDEEVGTRATYGPNPPRDYDDDDEEDSMGAEDIGNDGKPMWLRSVSARSLVHDAHI